MKKTTKKRRVGSARREKLYEEEFSPSLQVDEEAGVIRHVKLLGRVSKNGGRKYSDNALSQAAGLYEGKMVNIDHNRTNPDAERALKDRFGMLKEAVVESDGVFGDLHYLKSHVLAPQITEMASRMPETFGMSHDAEGMVQRGKSGIVVESVQRVKSVDVVGEPATTAGLFESKSEEPMTRTIQDIVKSVPHGTPGRSDLVRLIEEELAIGEIPMADVVVEDPPAEEPADDVKAAFRAAVMAAFDDESLDLAATVARIKDVLKAEEKLSDTPVEAPAEAPAPEGSEMTESITELQESVKSLMQEREASKNSEKFRVLLESCDRAVTPSRLAILADLKSDVQREALIESWPSRGTFGTPRPLSSPPVSLVESEGSAPKTFEDFKDFARV